MSASAYVCWFTETSEEESGDAIESYSARAAAEQFAAIHANSGEEEVFVTARAPSGEERRFRVAIELTYNAREIHR